MWGVAGVGKRDSAGKRGWWWRDAGSDVLSEIRAKVEGFDSIGAVRGWDPGGKTREEGA